MARVMSERGELSLEVTPLVEIGRSGEATVEVKRASFKDINADGISDLILHRQTRAGGGEPQEEAVEFVFDGSAVKSRGAAAAGLPFRCGSR